MFAKVYGISEAQRFGFDIQQHHLLQSTNLDGFDAFGYDVGNFLVKANKGIMKEMQAEPSDTNNDCYTRTTETNALLTKTFAF